MLTTVPDATSTSGMIPRTQNNPAREAFVGITTDFVSIRGRPVGYSVCPVGPPPPMGASGEVPYRL